MLLYLVRHAEAKKEEEDPLRPLSEKGLLDIKQISSHLSSLRIHVDRILHSGKLRAKQTAGVLSDNLKPSKGLTETNGLSPADDPAIIEGRLKTATESLMLVGHLPHLEKLASLLLCGDMYREVLSFRTAGVVCLERDDTGTWSVRWMITPEALLSPCDTGTTQGSDIYADDLGL